MASPDGVFADRGEAGRQLGRRLRAVIAGRERIVLGLPRGGVPVAHEVAAELGAPLDVLLVRKLGVPDQPELAAGAIASGGVRVLNHRVIAQHGLTEAAIEAVAAEEQRELERRERLYRGDAPVTELRGLTAILVDDGLATGATMRAAARAVKARGAVYVVVAVPVGAAETCRALREVVDQVVCLHAPASFRALSLWYRDFVPTGDAEVVALLRGPDSG